MVYYLQDKGGNTWLCRDDDTLFMLNEDALNYHFAINAGIEAIDERLKINNTIKTEELKQIFNLAFIAARDAAGDAARDAAGDAARDAAGDAARAAASGAASRGRNGARAPQDFKSTAILVVNDKSAAVLAAKKGANVVQGYVARDGIGVVNFYRPNCSNVPFEDDGVVKELVGLTKNNYLRVRDKLLQGFPSSSSLKGNGAVASAASPPPPGSAGVYTHNRSGSKLLEQLLDESNQDFNCNGQAVFRDVDLLDQDALFAGRFQIRKDVTSWFADPKNQCSAVTMLIRRELRHSPGFMSLIEGLGIRFFTKSAARNVDTVVVFRDAPTFLGAELPLFIEKLVSLACDGEGMLFPVGLNVVNAVCQAQLADSAGSSADRVSIWINDVNSDNALKTQIIECIKEPKPSLEQIYLKRTEVGTDVTHFILRDDGEDENLADLPSKLATLHSHHSDLKCKKYRVHNGIFIKGKGCVLMEQNKGFEAPSVYSCLANPPVKGAAGSDPVRKFYVDCLTLGLKAGQIENILLAEKALGDAEQAGLVVQMNDLLQFEIEAVAPAAALVRAAGGALEAGVTRRATQLNTQCKTIIDKLAQLLDVEKNSETICRELRKQEDGTVCEAMLIKTAGRVYISAENLCRQVPLVEVSQQGIYTLPTSLPKNFLLDRPEEVYKDTLVEILKINAEILRDNSAALKTAVKKALAAGAAADAAAAEEAAAVPVSELTEKNNQKKKKK